MKSFKISFKILKYEIDGKRFSSVIFLIIFQTLCFLIQNIDYTVVASQPYDISELCLYSQIFLRFQQYLQGFSWNPHQECLYLSI
ncbi:hypothetical protein pb186bvf_020081 [Paramecium bursaria]